MGRGVDIAILLLAGSLNDTGVSLECFSCSNVHNITDCKTTAVCSSNEKCFNEERQLVNSSVYTLGCRSLLQCTSHLTTQTPLSIVGRFVDAIPSTPVVCRECCGTDYCNKKLCAQGISVNTDAKCHDDPDYNCEFIGGTFNLCGDVDHAKTVCRKWCGLCDLVDGGWSVWSSWPKCDMTCGPGQKSRSRTCTEPKPARGGHDCIGNNNQVSNCTVTHCPVHGDWTAWSSWGSCSVTCGVGLQRKDRYCSNPYPGPDGNPCFGDSRDDRVCFTKACQDGGWTLWSHWSACSVTCDGGLRTRTRSCSNPSPSMFGRQCPGNNADKTSCNTKSCPVPVVIFSLYQPSSTFIGGGTNSGIPNFSHISVNIGGGYSTSTGTFTCRIAGVYRFSVYFNNIQTGSSGPSCTIKRNGLGIVYAHSHTDAKDSHQSASASVYLKLTIGDTVKLFCSPWNLIVHDNTMIFNGELVAKI